jgi:hypothetical protein
MLKIWINESSSIVKNVIQNSCKNSTGSDKKEKRASHVKSVTKLSLENMLWIAKDINQIYNYTCHIICLFRIFHLNIILKAALVNFFINTELGFRLT